MLTSMVEKKLNHAEVIMLLSPTVALLIPEVEGADDSTHSPVGLLNLSHRELYLRASCTSAGPSFRV